MSDIKIQPSATGTATVTLTAPVTNTARTITFPDSTSTLLASDGSGASLTGILTGITDNSNATAITINSSEQVGIGTTAPGRTLAVCTGDTKTQTNTTYAMNIIQTNEGSAFAQLGAYFKGAANAADRIFQLQPSEAGVSNEGIIEVNPDGGKFRAKQGIWFGTDTAAANCLDDYEEGTWTPTITFGGNAASIAYSTQTGHYTKVGRAVHIYGHVALSSKGSSTGHLNIRGLPFTPAGDYCPVALRFQNLSFADMATGIISSSAPASVLFYETSNGGTETTLTNSNAADNTRILFSCTYFT